MENTIIFIHGAGGSSDLWTRQRGLFPGSIFLDLPGHPSGEGRERIEDYASWVNEFRLQKKLDQVYLVGHSMGGAIALMCALYFPCSIKGLALLGAGPALSVSLSFLQRLEEEHEATVEKIVENAFAKDFDQRMIDKSREEMKKIPPKVLLGDFLACHRFQIEHRLEEIHAPTLILVGQEDRMTPVRLSKILAAKLPSSQLEILPQAGHMLMLEKHKEVNRLLKVFFQERAIKINQ